jgi:hypothetical protein
VRAHSGALTPHTAPLNALWGCCIAFFQLYFSLFFVISAYTACFRRPASAHSRPRSLRSIRSRVRTNTDTPFLDERAWSLHVQHAQLDCVDSGFLKSSSVSTRRCARLLLPAVWFSVRRKLLQRVGSCHRRPKLRPSTLPRFLLFNRKNLFFSIMIPWQVRWYGTWTSLQPTLRATHYILFQSINGQSDTQCVKEEHKSPLRFRARTLAN